VVVGDWVLRALEQEVAAHLPERGGALLGPRQRPLVTLFLADPEGSGSSTTWSPSRALAARVREVEREDGLELKGLVHSHPAGLDRPSAQDERELSEGLRRNGHMACYLAPIVTPGPEPLAEALDAPDDEVAPPRLELAPHELALGAGKISFFAAWRAEAGVRVLAERPRLLPLLRDLSRAADSLGAPAPELFTADAGTGPLPAGRLRLPGGIELIALAGDQYPGLPPVLLATPEGGATEQLHLPWALETAEEERLAGALRARFTPPGPYRLGFGPGPGPALTADPERARLAGWSPRFSCEDPDAAAAALQAALLARSEGILGRPLGERTVLVAGLGSVGSYVAEQLARSGVGGLALVDPEPVEAANLSRAAYGVGDLGLPKPEALARRLLAASPGLRLGLHPRRVEDLGQAGLDALVRGADLVVAATDDPAAQRALDRFAYARGKPALFVGLTRGAQGGEVVLTAPERTPCYLCATRVRHQVEQARGPVGAGADYGSGRLPGEMALGADVQHVASAAVKLGLSLLLRGGEGGLAAFAEEVVAAGATYLTLSTVARYWFYPDVFGDTPGQGAYQAVWLTPARIAGCPVCGEGAGRIDPLRVPLRVPGREAFPALDREGA